MSKSFNRTLPVLPGVASPSRVTELSCETIHEGFMDFRRLRLTHERFDGSMTPVIEREVCYRTYAVALILYDPATDRLVMIEQFRAAPYAAGRDPWMLEFVAGMVKDGENPVDVAIREAEEEAACTPRDVRHVYTMMPSPGGCTEVVEILFGLVDSTHLGGIHGLEEETEDIRVHLVPADEAIALMDANRIVSGFTLLGLNWFARHRNSFRGTAPAPCT